MIDEQFISEMVTLHKLARSRVNRESLGFAEKVKAVMDDRLLFEHMHPEVEHVSIEQLMRLAPEIVRRYSLLAGEVE